MCHHLQESRTQMNLILIFLHCVFTVASADPTNKVLYWTIEDLPTTCIFGSNVTLFCNTSAVGLRKTTWMKQSDVILHQGLSFYPDKYTGNEVTDGFSLIIKNATESDFNTSYTCLSDVYSYEAVLKINSSNFMCLPQNKNSSWIITGRNISVHLNLDRFFPVPNCTTKFNNGVLTTNQQESLYQENRFYHGIINITSHSSVDICGGNLTVVCMFGDLYSIDIATKFLQDCSVKGNSEYSLEFLGTVIGVFISLVILCIVCLLFFYVYVSERKTIKGEMQPGVNSEEITPFTEVVKSKKSDKKETEVLHNEEHRFIRHKKKQRTQTFAQYLLTDCFNLNRKNKDKGR
ncbi:uncharacterized protein LOC127732845 isoform X2 [Mytilus californianus]|uniref:uncharacterized protein LOC127732845 isoform X2 n=1 Tax=Mytilus californianus TaxID=6549 RepID=UPI0022471AC6|nr:uncharacterized protein LOC127732845 isoform X2 [Mytilus californianus]